MKKILVTFALFAMLTGSAFAGPIDWMMSKLGYTPTAEIINQRQQAELERLKLQAQIAELQLQQKQIEAKVAMRLYILLSVLTSVATWELTPRVFTPPKDHKLSLSIWLSGRGRTRRPGSR